MTQANVAQRRSDLTPISGNFQDSFSRISGHQSRAASYCLGSTVREEGWRFPMRRLLLVVALSLACVAARAGAPKIRVTLLGTGSPIPEPQRAGPATLVQAADQNLLFDAGRGVTTRLYQLKLSFRKVTPVFITHYHSDHINGLPDLWLSGWLG